MQHRFPSLLNPGQLGYVYDSDWDQLWNSYQACVQPLGLNCAFYKTLGDGTTQHSPLMAARLEHFSDYCVSLAHYILTMPFDPETSTLSYPGSMLYSHASKETVDFCAKVKKTPDKPNTYETRYFSVQLRKISKDPEKAHDKRWHRVLDEHDGSLHSAYDVLNADINHSRGLLQRYCWVMDLAAHPDISNTWEGKKRLLPVELYDNEFRANDPHGAFRSLDEALMFLEHRFNAWRVIDCVKRNVGLHERLNARTTIEIKEEVKA